MSVVVENALAGLPDASAGEVFEELLSAPGWKLERIVSRGQVSPPGFWYEQERAEWVMVLSGRAALEIEGQPEPLEMGPGDWVHLPARQRHRVAWTAAEEPTVWLALHHEAPEAAPGGDV